MDFVKTQSSPSLVPAPAPSLFVPSTLSPLTFSLSSLIRDLGFCFFRSDLHRSKNDHHSLLDRLDNLLQLWIALCIRSIPWILQEDLWLVAWKQSSGITFPTSASSCLILRMSLNLYWLFFLKKKIILNVRDMLRSA